MICKRCEVNQVKPERMLDGYCRHCHQAIKALDKINNLWDKVTNNG